MRVGVVTAINGCEEDERAVYGKERPATSPYHQKNERIRVRDEEAF
jgi:hypothetical protein